MSSFRTTAPSLPSCAYTASINGVTSSQAVRQVSRSVPIAAHSGAGRGVRWETQRACGTREEKQRARCFAIGAGDWADQLAAAMATTTRSVVVLAAPLVLVVVTCLATLVTATVQVATT